MSRRSRSLTLVELVAATAILAVAAAVLVPAIGGMARHLERQVTIQRLLTLRQGLIAYRDDVRSFPPLIDPTDPNHYDLRYLYFDDLVAPDGSDVPDWSGPYIPAGISSDPSTARGRAALTGSAGIYFRPSETPTHAQLAVEAFRLDGWGMPIQAYPWTGSSQVPEGVVLHSYGPDRVPGATVAEIQSGTATDLGDDLVETVYAYAPADVAAHLVTLRKMAILNTAWHGHLRARHLVPTIGMSGVYLLRFPGGFRPPRYIKKAVPPPAGIREQPILDYDGSWAALNDPRIGRGFPFGTQPETWGWWQVMELEKDGFLPGGDAVGDPFSQVFLNPNTRRVGVYHLWLTQDGLGTPFQYHGDKSVTVGGWNGPNLIITHPVLDTLMHEGDPTP